MRVAEVVAPVGFGGGFAAAVCLFGDGDFHPVLWQRGVRLLVVGGEAAPCEEQGERKGFEEGLHGVLL